MFLKKPNLHSPSFLKSVLFVICMLPSVIILAQTKIKGTVRELVSGEIMPFVNVGIKGTTVGTTTDVNGYYELETTEDVSKIQFSFIGYLTLIKDIVAGEEQTIDVEMKESEKVLDEVVIRPKKERYRNKDNPAVELIKKVIDNKNKNRLSGYNYVSYEEYEKLQLAVSNTAEKLKKSSILKKYKFVLDNVDTTRFEGKALLPIYLEENISDKYLSKIPERSKTIIKGSKRINFDERYINTDNFSTYLKHLYDVVDLYDNNMYVVTNSFLSPIANMAPTFYKFYITDTVAHNGEKLVELSFYPRNKADLLFQGKIYVTLDGNYGVQKAVMGVSKDINLNFVTDLNLTIEFEKNEAGRYRVSKNSLLANFGLFEGKGGLFGERTITVKNFQLPQTIADSVFKGEAIVKTEDAAAQTDAFWLNNRPSALTETEANTYKNMDSLNNMKSFKRLVWFASTFLAGYSVVGPVEIGPLSTFYSYNPVEGFRLRFGGRTTPELSKRYYGEAYGAYGFKDQRWKFYLGGTYSLNNKSIYNYPLNYIKASFQRETNIPGQSLQFMQEDNILLSIKRGINDKYLYNDIFRLEHMFEFGDHMSFRTNFNWQKREAAGGITFRKTDGTYDLVKEIKTTEVGIEWRWAPHEQFFQRKLYRRGIPNAYPIFTLSANIGIKGLLEGQYNYQKIDAKIFKRFYLSQLGFADVILNGGYVGGKVPYPLLEIATANQTYAYQLHAYSLMNFLEFVSDRYASVNVDYHMMGFIFNKVPLFKKLRLREVATLKVLYGGVRDENNPLKNKDLFYFPVDKNGATTTYSLEKQPYVEVSAGVENIFSLLRVDVVKRLNYLDHPNAPSWGVRARINFDF
jgi:hypothetical protein